MPCSYRIDDTRASLGKQSGFGGMPSNGMSCWFHWNASIAIYLARIEVSSYLPKPSVSHYMVVISLTQKWAIIAAGRCLLKTSSAILVNCIKLSSIHKCSVERRESWHGIMYKRKLKIRESKGK